MTAAPRQEAGQGAVILGCAGLGLARDEQAFFRDADPWGFILFARNIDTPDQLRRLTAELRASVGRDAPILIDQEGGRVQRMRAPHWREWLPPLDLAALVPPKYLGEAMRLRYRIIAAELRSVGIDVNCAPTCDIAGPETHPFLKNRCYGTDVSTVVAAARGVAQGLLEGGVLPVAKHMPGHGRASLDTHQALPRVTADLDTLMASDFAVFRALNDLPMGMTAHIIFEAIDPQAPATQSAAMIALIRDRIGFDGLLMTDDLSMQALTGSIGERAAQARAAGCDLALHCNGDLPEMQAVVTAAGRMTPAEQMRAQAALARRVMPDPVDIAELEAKLGGLLDRQAED
jgi:beta-N-acetylhexosaminidase